MKPKFNCFEDQASFEGREVSGVCLLESGHSGPHVFTPGKEVFITFVKVNSQDVEAPAEQP